MILCIDAGNTRLKWALANANGEWVSAGTCSHQDVQSSIEELVRQNSEIVGVAFSNVAGDACAQAVQQAVGDLPLQTIQSSPQALGVMNGYQRPEMLGVDRWCSLVAAWQLQHGACLVVSLGTATTVDALDESGHFLGGLILPGITLMRSSLAERTAQLPLVSMVADKSKSLTAWPNSTDEAIIAGSLESTAGAIERAWQKLALNAKTPPVCVLTGGAGSQLLPFLALPSMAIVVREHLVLEGVYRLSSASSKPNA